ncbi:MAG: hypothetical protein LBV02_07170 [Bacteroidales bacterium]|jgi:hypothetical protein|nr:hypothetical protein [Bacteroidales bacterium]
MKLKERIKYAIISNQVEKRKASYPFDVEYAEKYEIPDGETNHPNNSYYFSVHDQKGQSLLFRWAKRQDREELWFVFHDKNAKSYYNRDQLATEFSKAEVECLEVGKSWRFKFSGPMIQIGDDGLEHHADFEGIFTSSAPIFEFSRHSATAPVARALAKEKWNMEFKRSVIENHQVHYEQAGTVKGKLLIDGETVEINSRAMRDHSFGKREWNYMDRHIWLTGLLETGAIINVNMVRYPAVYELQSGYMEQNGKYVCIDSATPMDELVMKVGVPKILDCNIKLEDDRGFTMHCVKEIEVLFPFDNGDYTIYEGIGEITLNGVKGRGIIEVGFNREEKRWRRGR